MNEASKISFSIKQFGAKSKAPGSVSFLSARTEHIYVDFVALIEQNIFEEREGLAQCARPDKDLNWARHANESALI